MDDFSQQAHTADRDDDYRALRGSAASVILPRAILRLSGTDAFDFLHRMTTNDLGSLGDHRTRRTVVVSEKGRVIDLVTVFRIGDDAFLVGSPGTGDALARWFGKFIIMDDVRIAASLDRAALGALYGPGSREAIRTILGVPDSGDDRGDPVLDWDGGPGWIVREDLGTVPGFLYVPAAIEAGGFAGPAAPWSGGDFPAVDHSAYETVRIEESVPEAGRELGPDVNALEAGLKPYINFSKGCYIGQEVIARLDTYKKLRDIITLFLLPSHEGSRLSPGTVFQDGREAGRITSTIYSPANRGWIGLGYRRVRLTDAPFSFRQEGEERMIPCRCLTRFPEGYDEYEVQE